jgi:hypothetical protein
MRKERFPHPNGPTAGALDMSSYVATNPHDAPRLRDRHSHAKRIENTPVKLVQVRHRANLASDAGKTCPRMTKSSLIKKNRAVANENSARAQNMNEPIRHLKDQALFDVIGFYSGLTKKVASGGS